MKTVLAVLALAFATTLMVGCGSETFTPDTVEHLPDMVNVPTYKVHLQNGGYLTCAYLTQAGIYGGTGGPTCDWSKAE